MDKFKKHKLLFLLALNSLAISGGVKANSVEAKYDNIYDNMVKNFQIGKSNSDNYKLLEKILNKRNKELKDLYAQTDYIVKPEFLEWQIFFSDFYGSSHRGGSKDKITFTEGKPKAVDLGMVIPVNGITKEPINLNIASIAEPIVNVNIPEININPPIPITYTPITVQVPFAPAFISLGYSLMDGQNSPTIGQLTNLVAYNTTGTKIYENLNISSPGGTTISWNGNPSSPLTMTGATNYVNGGVNGATPASASHTGQSSTLALNNIGLTGDYNITGNWNVNVGSNQLSNFAFVSYRPNYITANSSVTNNGTLTLTDVTSVNLKNIIVGMELDLTNTTAIGQPTARMENKGNIVISHINNVFAARTIGMQLDSLSTPSSIKGELINSGKISLVNAPGTNYGHSSTGILINNGTVSPVADVKVGNIDVKSNYGIGLEVARGNNTTLTGVNIDGSGGVIDMAGSYNVGAVISAPIASAGASNQISNVKNLNINFDSLYSTGIIVGIENGQNTILDNNLVQSFTANDNANSSVFIINYGGNVTVDSSLANVINNNKGRGNVVLVNAEGSMINYMPITVGSGTKSGSGIYNGFDTDTAFLQNYGDIVVNSTRDPDDFISSSVGIATLRGTAENYANITMNTDYSDALFGSVGSITSNTGNIIVNGNSSVGIFASVNGPGPTDKSIINLESGNIELNGTRGTLFYIHGGSLGLGSAGNTVTATVNGENSYLFYSTEDYYFNTGTATINGNVNSEVKNGATAFFYQGLSPLDPPVDLSAYLASVINVNSGTLNVNIDNNSYLFGISATTLNISSLNNLQLTGANLTGSKRAKISDATLNVDIDSNLDKLNNTGNKTYRDVEVGRSGITINPGITVSGTEDNQAGISQASSFENLVNAGTINLSGQNVVGIYGSDNTLLNNGVINLENARKGTGLYSDAKLFTFNTAINNSTINIGQGGIGIYGNTEDFATLTVNNFGTITGNGDSATGIYINNTGEFASANLELSSTSNINVKDSENGIGIYTNSVFMNIVDAGTITVGKNGIGVYSKDEATTLNNLTLNLFGDNSVGIYTDGTNYFSGDGTVNIDGKGVVIFNVLGTGGFDQNFNVTSTAGSSYTFWNMKDSTLYSDSSIALTGNGMYLNGNNSAILLGTNSNLTSSDSNVVGIALNGAYAGGLPVTINSEVLNQEATNKGNMSFGANSTGIYVINGASGENQGTISLGANSVAVYGNGIASNVSNTGTITIGTNSAGMYLKDGDNLLNTGNINGTDERTIGLYLNGNTASTVSNSGTINLSGDQSVGIYTIGAGVQTINNTGSIILGDSSTETNPNIAIYNDSNNNIVNNSGNITSGKTSIGIYNKGGQVNQTSGTINTGESGVGIYSDSGSLNLNSGTLNLSGLNTVGIYGINSAVIDNNMLMNVSDGSFGVVLNSGSTLVNRNTSTIGENGVFVYSDGGTSITNELGANVTMTGSKSVGFYMTGGDVTNKASITANTGDSNIGIYNKGGNINNSGDIKIGDSVIVDPLNPFANSYAVGLYGEDIRSMKNTGNIEIGADAVGFYAKGSQTEVLNTGNITSSSNKAIGMYLDGSAVRNTGNITLSGDSSIGIAAARNSSVKNAGIITMNGNDSIGIYANANSTIVNESTGKVFINGNNSTGIQLSGSSTLENYGLIEISSGTIGSVQVVEGTPAFTPPSIINAGVIKVDEKFDLSGMNIIIKSDPASFRTPTIEEITAGSYVPNDINAAFLLTDTVSIIAPSFDFGDRPIGIDPNFTQGTNARVYKFENVFDPTTPGGGPNTGEIAVESGSLTFEAIPVTNENGKIDVWMEKINYDKFTQGAWYDSFAKNIEGNYLNATGDALKFYDKLDLVTDVNDLRNDFSQLSGSMYANIAQREQNINEVFNNALDLLQNSGNNTKESVKVNIITGKGSSKEDTSGVESYDYNTYGVLALREVEQTYRHKFGYSLGYTRTDFQMDETNNEDQADTIQLGLHNKYSINGWDIKNDLLGRVSFHDVDRSIDWSGGTRSEMNSNYNVYGVSSLNELGKDLEISRNAKVTPYVGLELGYMMHPSFEEKGGAESLKVDSNDAYSIKPNVGIRLDGEKEFGATSSWKVKGNIGVGYEYELGNMNNQEKASLVLIEDGYHELAKTAEDKGKIKTSGYAGVELKGKYGVYVTGEYGIGDDDQEDYKIGVSLKAIF